MPLRGGPLEILFPGVQVSAKPIDSEWMRFEQLSGGQQAIVSVALNLSFQVTRHQPSPRLVPLRAASPAAKHSSLLQTKGCSSSHDTSTLSYQARENASICLFDEIDAALDTQRTQALARHVAARQGSQAIFVSHRPPM